MEPSFDPYFVVGAIHEEDGKAGRTRVAWPSADSLLASPVQTSLRWTPTRSPDALGRLNPFRVEPAHRTKWILHKADRTSVEESWGEGQSLDGLGYSVRWQTKAVRDGGFEFSNPSAGWPLEFERLLYQFARSVTIAGGVGELECAGVLA